MEVMVMIGAFAGQIRDIRPDMAAGMIERGEAIDARVLSAPPIANAPALTAKGADLAAAPNVVQMPAPSKRNRRGR